MSGTAIRKVLEAVAETLATVPGFTVEIDRPTDKPFGRVQAPAVNIRFIGENFDLFDHATMLHEMEVDLDLYAVPTASESISLAQAEMQAAAVAVLWADRFLGGRVQDVTPQSFEGESATVAEAGVAPLKLKVLYLTPIGDFRTIIGQAGTRF